MNSVWLVNQALFLTSPPHSSDVPSTAYATIPSVIASLSRGELGLTTKKNMCFKSHCWNDWVYLETTRSFRIPTLERDPNMNNGAIARYVINSVDCHLWVLIKLSQLSKPYFLVSSVVGFPHDSLTNSFFSNSSLPKEWKMCIWSPVDLLFMFYLSFSKTNHRISIGINIFQSKNYTS